ncbi:MAG: acyl-CoA dehydrogenase [Oligoflexales bacterium]
MSEVLLGLLMVKGAAIGLAYFGAPLAVWTLAYAGVLLFYFPLVAAVVLAAPLVALNIPAIRQSLLSAPVMSLLEKLKLMPVISETEKVALEAGTTWVEGELFSGKPDFNEILKQPWGVLSPREQAFIDGPVEKVCRMIDDYKTFQDGDLAPEVWEFLKKEKFFGMIVPENYGGLGFSALANSEVVGRLSSASVPLSITVMVPNSLGPAELINHYGTQKQKDYYLSRLANGEELPCFALTEPGAGSDAGSMQSSGEVFKDKDGKLMIRMNWEKRYITLGGVASLLGIAIKLKDPENYLGKGKEPGITCVLVHSDTPGVIQGERHDPLGIPFINSPLRGENVEVSVDQIIGGEKGAGMGWRMLMECLAAGRAISLPAQATSTAKYVARVVGAYAAVRQQFGVSISQFEGIQEQVCEISANAYLLEALRVYTVGAVDSGYKPAVVSAVAKYQATEIARQSVVKGMDVVGGSGISKGPRNLLANFYSGSPIGITVEGANILTRTMIIFGQGAIRCHPYAYKEMQALAEGNVADFDDSFWKHVGHVVRNAARSFVLSLTRGFFAQTPGGEMRRYYQKLSWVSASFAVTADLAMGALGGQLKMKERMTGRFADILSWMYLISAVLKRYEAEGCRQSHAPLVHYCAKKGFSEIQLAFQELFSNFYVPVPVLGELMRWIVAPWARVNTMSSRPSDPEGAAVADAITTPGELRDLLTGGLFTGHDDDSQMMKLEKAFILSVEASKIQGKVRKAIKGGQLKKGPWKELLKQALKEKVIEEREAVVLEEAVKMRIEAEAVDAWPLEHFTGTQVSGAHTAEQRKKKAS